MIISYEMFLRSVEEIRSIKFGLVICDEAHRLKNTTIKTATVRASWFFFWPYLIVRSGLYVDLAAKTLRVPKRRVPKSQ